VAPTKFVLNAAAVLTDTRSLPGRFGNLWLSIH
jgi:hypothetical protein